MSEEQQSREVKIVEPSGEVISVRLLDDRSVEEARRRTEIVERLKAVAISHTKPHQWRYFGDTPYLEEDGARIFAVDFGVSFTDLRVEQVDYEDERGRRIDFVAYVTARWQGLTCEADGGRSTADEFWNGVDKDGKPRRLPLSEIKVMDVRKAAVASAKRRATISVLALSFTREEVAAALQAGGRDASQVGQVRFEHGRRGGKGGAESSEANPKLEEAREKLRRAILAYTQGDTKAAHEVLWALSKFTAEDGREVGARSITRMKEAWFWRTYAKAKEDAEIGPFLAGGPAQEAEPAKPKGETAAEETPF